MELEHKKEFAQTDLGNAQLLAHLHGSDLRWCAEKQRWYVWESGEWVPEVPSAGKVVRLWLNCLRRLEATGNKDNQKWAHSCQAKGRIMAAIDLARALPGMQIAPNQMDQDPYILNTPTGSLDLRTGKVGDHDRLHYCTMMTAAGVGNIEEKLPEDSAWRKFLFEITMGRGDLAKAMMNWMGYCLTGLTNQQVFALAVGTGRNGKNTLWGLLARLLGGDYAKPLPSELLLSSRMDRPTHSLESIGGARFVLAEEPDAKRELDREWIKSLVSGERRQVCAKYGHPYEWTPACKLVLMANHKPSVQFDDAFRRRTIVFPFDLKITEIDVDSYLGDRLWDEREIIMASLARGAARFFEEGLIRTDAMKEELDSYEEDNDYLAQFIDSKCEIGLDEYVHPDAFTKAYNAWAKEMSYPAMPSRDLKGWMKRKGFKTERKGHKQLFCFAGICLADGESRSAYQDKMAGLD
jgi:putative DNA primase/helicase